MKQVSIAIGRRRSTDYCKTSRAGGRGESCGPLYLSLGLSNSGSLAMFAAILRAFCEAKDALVLSVAGVTAIIVWLPSSCG